uniref:CAAX prenyl protease 2 n=1 Tax=Ciona intestinalis TaxID=7719 RepID=H2XJQ7_CIOIN|nr:CAAX prenyl protease 2-like [Ciona intestinalis]|eukprot:XP_002131463.1 CAAX prenyl protease 2-like [Ciona intestinalis]
MLEKICFTDVTTFQAVATCFSFATMYVGSLYVRTQFLPRDHPQTIKERFLRVTVVSILACVVVYMSSSSLCGVHMKGSILEWIGIRWSGFIPAIILPSLLIIILFLGPMMMFILDHGITSLTCYKLTDIILWRNFFVAPLSEELVFRGCMMPLLVPCLGQFTSILLAPWFFGLAHFHHAYEQYKTGYHTLSAIVISTIFQASYTTVFGILSSFIFLRTGHLTSAFMSHALCNIMGFPEFELALSHKRRNFVCFCFVLGLVIFLLSLYPLTNPLIYNNTLYFE